MQTKKIHNLGIFLVLMLGLFGCNFGKITQLQDLNISFGSNVTPIHEIKPSQNPQATIYIQGKVEKQVPLIEKQAYQISDATGKIWVVTNKENAKIGDVILMKGKIRYQSIPIAGQEFGEVYLVEE